MNTLFTNFSFYGKIQRINPNTQTSLIHLCNPTQPIPLEKGVGLFYAGLHAHTTYSQPTYNPSFHFLYPANPPSFILTLGKKEYSFTTSHAPKTHLQHNRNPTTIQPYTYPYIRL